MESTTGEEIHSFIGDIELLSKHQRAQLRYQAYIIMQLKRCTRDELKGIIGYTLELDKEVHTQEA